jgi:hypothetical protein
MSKEKQIEEMKYDICTAADYCYGACEECNLGRLAEHLYNAGYRKQSEGEWVDEPNFAQKGLKGKYYVCSNCNVCVPAIEELPLYQWEYCPRCGAKMKGGEE